MTENEALLASGPLWDFWNEKKKIASKNFSFGEISKQNERYREWSTLVQEGESQYAWIISNCNELLGR